MLLIPNHLKDIIKDIKVNKLSHDSQTLAKSPETLNSPQVSASLVDRTPEQQAPHNVRSRNLGIIHTAATCTHNIVNYDTLLNYKCIDLKYILKLNDFKIKMLWEMNTVSGTLAVFCICFYYTVNFWLLNFSYNATQRKNMFFKLDFTSFLTILVEMLSLFSFLFQNLQYDKKQYNMVTQIF